MTDSPEGPAYVWQIGHGRKLLSGSNVADRLSSDGRDRRDPSAAMFDWLLRHVLCADCRVRRLMPAWLTPKFGRCCAFGCLLVRFSCAGARAAASMRFRGRMQARQGGDPSLSVLSLGLASLTMVLADADGFYADRHRPKRRLRSGCGRQTASWWRFFGMAFCARCGQRSLSRCRWDRGRCCFEGAISVSLALLSGADTVLFLQVARRSQIPGLLHPSFEGVGSSIRYLGTMVAVLLGALFYDLCVACAGAASAHCGAIWVVLLTSAAELVALAELANCATTIRRCIVRGCASCSAVFFGGVRVSALFAELWLLSMAAAVALFYVYLVQSPLSRLSTALATQHPLLWPLTRWWRCLAYWACSVGSQRFARHRGEALIVLPRRSLSLTLGSWLLLLLLPLGFYATENLSIQPVVVLTLCIVLCLLFNFVRVYRNRIKRRR